MRDFDGGFGNIEVFCEKFYKSSISLTVMRFGAQKDRQLMVARCDDFFLRGARFYDYSVFHDYII